MSALQSAKLAPVTIAVLLQLSSKPTVFLHLPSAVAMTNDDGSTQLRRVHRTGVKLVTRGQRQRSRLVPVPV